MGNYIADAVVWDGLIHAWVRMRDINYIESEQAWMPACSYVKVLIHDAFPYEGWMDEYIGTTMNLKSDKRLKRT